jgi:hypothetical protein
LVLCCAAPLDLGGGPVPRGLIRLAMSVEEPGGVVMHLSCPPVRLGASLEGSPATVAVAFETSPAASGASVTDALSLTSRAGVPLAHEGDFPAGA